jgi:glycosyltransferase involved in cell wall biosynthesis
MMRKVLIVTDEMEVGGSQRQINRILTHLDRSQFEPTLLYFRNRSFLVDQVESFGIRTIQIDKRGKLDVQFLFRFIRFLRRERFSVVQAFAFSAEFWTALSLLFAPKTRFITSIRCKYEWYRPIDWLLKKWVTLCSSKVVSNSATAAAYAFDRMSLDRQRLQVIYNGISLPEETQQIPDDLQALRTKYDWLLTFVGRLVDQKNLPCLMRAVHRLKPLPVRLGVLIVGDGPERDRLLAMCQEFKLTNVHFLGGRRDVDAIFAISNAAVLPSFWEGLSNALLEAMASGLPVIASAVGGNPEVVQHEHNGLLFEADQADQLANAIERLVNDLSLATALGSRARQDIATRFSVSTMIHQFEALYSAAG